MSKPFIRYPGGKSKHVRKILQYFHVRESEYREPFVGGGSVYLAAIGFRNSWINDVDVGVYDLWKTVKEDPYKLIDLIEEHTPIIDHRKDPVRIKYALDLWEQIQCDTEFKLYPPGYRFLFLSKTCFSGLVTAGPTGGMHQTGKYNLTSRWSRTRTVKHILEAHKRLQDCKITNLSWEHVVQSLGNDVAMFLDPPYLRKGSQCYQKYFTLKDHKKLAEIVTSSGYRYVVTVDDTPEIRNIWKHFGIMEDCMIPDTWLYSMSGTRKRNKKGKELFVIDQRAKDIAELQCFALN